MEGLATTGTSLDGLESCAFCATGNGEITASAICKGIVSLTAAAARGQGYFKD